MEAFRLPTIQDIYSLPEGVHAELIDGQIYYQAAPSTEHQEIVAELTTAIRNYVKKKGGGCRVLPAPYAVYLQNDKNYVEPDLSIICDANKIDSKGCHGAPDWIIEVISKGSAEHDTITKLKLYATSGVREYWIIDPVSKTVLVHNLEHGIQTSLYGFEKVKAGIYSDLVIDFSTIQI